MSAELKYTGTLPQVEVSGYGHFAPGDVKTVDEGTAIQFENDPNAESEGWEVSWPKGSRKKQRADTEDDDTQAAHEDTVRGSRARSAGNKND